MESGWNVSVWLAGGGRGWNLRVWQVGVVVRRYIDFPHITYPYSSCICSFLQQHPYFLFIFFRSCYIININIIMSNLRNPKVMTLKWQSTELNNYKYQRLEVFLNYCMYNKNFVVMMFCIIIINIITIKTVSVMILMYY